MSGMAVPYQQPKMYGVTEVNDAVQNVLDRLKDQSRENVWVQKPLRELMAVAAKCTKELNAHDAESALRAARGRLLEAERDVELAQERAFAANLENSP